MKHNSTAYIFKIWVTMVVLAPIIQFALGLINHFKLDLTVFISMVVLGGLASTPGLLILLLLCRLLVRQEKNIFMLKLLLTFSAIILSYIPFWVINDFEIDLQNGYLALYLPYCLTIILGIWVYKLKVNETTL